ncbi:MAG TPA: LptA/OstA family protein, partial [Treponemataceae bacterium]|nr:LptA/OstA family protein [Treponemataceae bacterium]
AEVKTDDLEIQADFIEISGKDFRFITASGRVSGKNLTSNFSFSCERLHYDRITKVALLESAVELHDIENDVQINAQSIEYNQKTDIATMQIEVRLTSKDSICTSALAIYNKAQQRVVLSGSPKIERNKDIFQAQEIILDIQTEEIKLDGKIRGSIVNENAEDKKQEKDKSD